MDGARRAGAKVSALRARKRCMDKKRRPESGVPGTLLEKTLWLLLVVVILYVCLAVAPDLITAKFYELVWATME